MHLRVPRMAFVALSLGLFLLPSLTFAALYAPGATLDPACAPTDSVCGVASSVGAGTTGQFPYYAADGNVLSAISTSTARLNLGLSYATNTDIATYHIATWGDSLTWGGQGGGETYPMYLSNITNRSVYNGGISGQTSSQIAQRMIAATTMRTYTTVIWAGRNNFGSLAVVPNSSTQVASDVAAMVASLGSNTNYLVFSLLNDNTQPSGSAAYNQIMQVNSDLAAQNPGHYFDIRTYLVQNGLSDLGITPTAQDLLDIASDIVPSTLRFDYLHLNSLGYLVVAQQAAKFINANGYGTNVQTRLFNLQNLPGLTLLTSTTTNLFGGDGTGVNLTNGTFNTAFGLEALEYATSTSYNTALGFQALRMSGYGANASTSNSGNRNTGVGYQALYGNSTGTYNTGSGFQSSVQNTTGSFNTSLGSFASFLQDGGGGNTAVGYASGLSGGNRSYNTTVGFQSGYNLTSGSYNIALGANVDLPSNTGIRQLNIGNVVYGTNLYNGSTPSSAPIVNGTFGVGTTTPFATLSIHSNNSSTNTTLFAIASSTSNSTTTLFSISNTGLVRINATATTTSNVGVNITGGCFAVNGACITAGGGGGVTSVASSDGTLTISPTSGSVFASLNLANANTWSGLQQFTNASSSQFSVYNSAYFGGSATSTFTSAGRLGILTASPAYALDVSGFINTDQYSGFKQAGNTILYSSTTNSAVLVGTLGGTTISSSTVTFNTSVGYQSLNSNTSGANNAYVGSLAGFANTSGGSNAAEGFQALEFNTTGSNNVAVGSGALINNTLSNQNIAIGVQAAQGLGGSYSNSANVAIGHQAGRNFGNNSNFNTLIGYQSGYNITTGTNNIFLGAQLTRTNATITTGSGNIGIGYDISMASSTASNQLNVGNLIYGTGLSGTGLTISPGSIGVGTTTPYGRLSVWGVDAASSTLSFNVVNSASTTLFAVFNGGNAQLSGTLTQSSDRRLKTNITALDASTSLAAIVALNPVTYTWIEQSKGSATQLGFIAQDVQQIFPDLVSTTSATSLTPDGTLGINYLGFIAPLIKAVQALAHQVATLTATVQNFAESITTKKVNTDQLCAKNDDGTYTCVTGEELKKFLSNSNGGGNTTIIQMSAPTPPVIDEGDANTEGSTTTPVIDDTSTSTPDTSGN